MIDTSGILRESSSITTGFVFNQEGMAETCFFGGDVYLVPHQAPFPELLSKTEPYFEVLAEQPNKTLISLQVV